MLEAEAVPEAEKLQVQQDQDQQTRHLDQHKLEDLDHQVKHLLIRKHQLQVIRT